MARHAETEKLIINHNRRLQKLKEQLALQGISADPKISLEIEDIEAEIAQLQASLVSPSANEIADTDHAPTSTQQPAVVQMKYYLYVSRFKVDMLWSQIPGAVLDDSAMDETQQLYARLQAVVDYIDNTGEVGTIDNPKSYFRGKLPLSWAILGAYPELGLDAHLEGVVYFGGKTQHTVLGLGGSAKHVIGIPENQSKVTMSSSSSTRLLVTLSRELKQKGIIDELEKPLQSHIVAATTRDVCEAQPAEPVEFLAKTLHCEDGILLGTPIYVAMAEEL
jgi:hypothetical protein